MFGRFNGKRRRAVVQSKYLRYVASINQHCRHVLEPMSGVRGEIAMK